MSKNSFQKKNQTERHPAGQMIKSNRAVSEVMGYILVFGIVIIAIGSIYVIGFPTLQSSKDTTQFQSVEQGFTILHTDLLKVALDQAPVRTTKLGTAEGGSLTSDPDACNMVIKITHSGGTEEHSIFMGNVEFNSRIGAVACENGAVLTKYPSSSIMVSKPRMFNSTDQGTILFSLIKINDSFSSVGGGIAEITISNPRFNESIFNTPEVYEDGNLRLTVESEYADAWERFISEEFNTNFGSPADGTTGESDAIPFNKLVIVEYIVSVDVG